MSTLKLFKHCSSSALGLSTSDLMLSYKAELKLANQFLTSVLLVNSEEVGEASVEFIRDFFEQ